ncbi:DEAD/DEAH box helicase [Egibacter rhizosphaerae]|uniref:DEAD/DEAH box helicase n=1 Tax=Egibacter rhizosphaerae TaxID=1670831 RepID=A0A411YLA9_9ACTN|nr:DEAD/DEAH box helicase [Egibacter rhizosphaerae]
MAGDLTERHPPVPDADRTIAPRIAASHRLPARPARTVPLPDDLPPVLRQRLADANVAQLFTHQAEAHARLRAGRHTVVATGTASGKSLCYQLPLLERLTGDDRATALYLAPTKALARDQLRALRDFRLPHVRAAAYDGDTPRHERDAVRRTANVVLTNPDMLHTGLLPHHRRWADFLHRLEFVVIDELHTARGVFGAHVAAVLRRLRRVAERYGAAPTFAFASATIANPGEHAHHLTGLDVDEITVDGSPRPAVTLSLWDPPLTDPDAGTRRSTLAETSDLLSGMVQAGPATLAFVKSRKAAELVAAAARERVGDRVLAYRAGLLPEERRHVERGLTDGSLRGVAATDALELGVDVGNLDAVVIAGWPGTAASLWQQAGRAGRRDREAVVVFVADDDPLDRYLLRHPEHLWSRPLEAATADVSNPHVLAPHVRCAAFELPVADEEEACLLGTDARAVLAAEEEAGRLRRRGDKRYWAGRGSPAGNVAIRSAGGEPFRIVHAATGELIGDVDEARAFRTVHPGAVYVHQGAVYAVDDLDLDDRIAAVSPYDGDVTTHPRVDTDVTVADVAEEEAWGRCGLARGRVEVTTQVLAYERRRLFTGESLGVVDLDLPRSRLDTRAFWLTIAADVLAEAGLPNNERAVAGAAHAAEHAAIGLLPLTTMCDRWDVGGLSTPWHPDTGAATIFVYDGYPGGAGIADRAFRAGVTHLVATRDAVAGCGCTEGCPSCVQSPKCGNGNEPLDKAGAVRLLSAVLDELAEPSESAG